MEIKFNAEYELNIIKIMILIPRNIFSKTFRKEFNASILGYCFDVLLLMIW